MLKLLNPQKILKGLASFFSRARPFPSNVIVTAAHGSYKIPLSIFPKLSPEYQMSPRLLLNFSDYGTKYLIESVPENQKVIPKYGRLVGDPNRAKNASDIIRFRDFGENPIFSEKFEKRLTTSWFHNFWLHKILKLSYHPFYDSVFERIESAVKNPANEAKPLVLIDVHDTGNLILGTTKKENRRREDTLRMPKVILSNAPDEMVGEGCFGTAPDYLLEFFRESLIEKCEFPSKEVRINYLFNGGHVTRFFGNPISNEKLRKTLEGKTLYTIQLEFDRGIYMDEKTQRPIPQKIKKIRNALTETILEMNEVLIPLGSY